MKKDILLISLLLFLISSNALPPAGAREYESYFTWNENKKLNWNDFQGKSIKNTAEAAMTSSSVEFTYFTKGSQIRWEVKAKYFPKLSWSKKSSHSDYILQHEQLHFDITELYARLFRKRLEENVKTSKDIQMLNSIGKDIVREWQQEQSAYDKETKHSMDEEKQVEWNSNVLERLEELKEFASK